MAAALLLADAEPETRGFLERHLPNHFRIDPNAGFTTESLSTQFEENAAIFRVDGFFHSCCNVESACDRTLKAGDS